MHTVIKDPTRRLQALLSGKVDFLRDPPLADLDEIEGTPGLKLERTNETRTIFSASIREAGSSDRRTSRAEPVCRPALRQAVYQAIDEDAILDKVMSGLAIPAGIIIQPPISATRPSSTGGCPSTPTPPGHRSPRPATRGFAVTLDWPNDRYINDEAICRVVAAMLGEVGIASPWRRGRCASTPRIKNRETDFYMLGCGRSTYDSLGHLDYLIRSEGSITRRVMSTRTSTT